MATPLRKSTASQVVQFTLIDSTDFKTPKTGLTIANTDIKLIFEGGTTQTSKNSGGATEIGSTGTYYTTFDATDTATLGRLHIDIQKSGALPYFKDTEVLPAVVWDALYASSGGALPAEKTGYKLASDGLDSIATTAPAGVAANFREMLVQTWRRFFAKSTMTATELKTYADNGSTVISTQTLSDDGVTQTQGAAS